MNKNSYSDCVLISDLCTIHCILEVITDVLLLLLSKVKSSKQSIAVSELHHTATGNHMPYGITQCYLPPGSGDFPALPQPKLVLDLATPEDARLS